MESNIRQMSITRSVIYMRYIDIESSHRHTQTQTHIDTDHPHTHTPIHSHSTGTSLALSVAEPAVICTRSSSSIAHGVPRTFLAAWSLTPPCWDAARRRDPALARIGREQALISLCKPRLVKPTLDSASSGPSPQAPARARAFLLMSCRMSPKRRPPALFDGFPSLAALLTAVQQQGDLGSLNCTPSLSSVSLSSTSPSALLCSNVLSRLRSSLNPLALSKTPPHYTPSSAHLGTRTYS